MSKIAVIPAETPSPERSMAAGSRGAATAGWVALIVLASGIAYGAGSHMSGEAAAEAATAARTSLVPTVRTAAAQRLAGSVPLELPASVEPIETAAINARASGYVTKRLVDIGSPVKEGQVMAVIQSRELEQQVAQAAATLTQSRANLELAHATAGRTASLRGEGWVTAQQFDQDRLTESARSADVKAAEASYAVVSQKRDYLTVTAPFDGVVTARNVEVGDLVSADSAGAHPLFNVARTDKVKVQVRVPQDAADGLDDGVAAAVTVPELAGQTFKGTVTRTAHALDSASRTLLVEVDIDNPTGALAAGLYARVHFDLAPEAARVRLDANALIYNADGLKVALVQDGRVRLVPIHVGRDFGPTLEVTEGLKGGETVVLNPPLSLHEGSAVTVAAS
jgi:RND family efflux transporter MFP subunit